MSLRKDRPDVCELCGAAEPENFHHLIPRICHANKWFKKNFSRRRMQEGLHVCLGCHGAVNRIEQKELGRKHNTRESLLEHPEVAAFVAWRRRQK
jgi:hypothetical protein